MKQVTRGISITLVVAVFLLLLVSSGLAQGDDGYDLSWWTVDGGGHTFSTGGDYSLGGAAGQADAGAMTGGTYLLDGGFWGGAGRWWRIYLPLALKNYP